MRADILVTHETPDYHPNGFAILDTQAQSLGVKVAVHGHHHDAMDSSSRWPAQEAGADLEALVKGRGTAVRRETGAASASPKPAPSFPPGARTGNAAEAFSACRQFFAGGKPPAVPAQPGQRALCYAASLHGSWFG